MKNRRKELASRSAFPRGAAQRRRATPANGGQKTVATRATGPGDAATGGGPPSPRPSQRGAAPWAARHAEKHAAEAAARNREPPKPGSARATLRVPDEAERLKQRIALLHHALVSIRGFRKNFAEGFFQLARVLHQIREERLYDAKGYASFEAFVEREVDLGKETALKLARVPEVFVEAEARRYGMGATLAALDTLEQYQSSAPAQRSLASRQNLKPLKPPK